MTLRYRYGLVPVRRLPTQSQSRHFCGVSEKKKSLGARDPKRISRPEQ